MNASSAQHSYNLRSRGTIKDGQFVKRDATIQNPFLGEPNSNPRPNKLTNLKSASAQPKLDTYLNIVTESEESKLRTRARAYDRPEIQQAAQKYECTIKTNAEIRREYDEYNAEKIRIQKEKREFEKAERDLIVRQFENARRLRDQATQRRFALDAIGRKNVLQSEQTVHVSSINKSCVRTLDCVNKLAASVSHEMTDIQCIDDLARHLYGNLIIRQFMPKYVRFRTYCNTNPDYYANNRRNTYCHIIAQIWRVILHNPRKFELMSRLRMELDDSIGQCFVGHIHRALNALTCLVDGCNVSYSDDEAIHLKIQMIIARLQKRAITFDTAKTEMTDAVHVWSADKAQSWLDALEDYRN